MNIFHEIILDLFGLETIIIGIARDDSQEEIVVELGVKEVIRSDLRGHFDIDYSCEVLALAQERSYEVDHRSKCLT